MERRDKGKREVGASEPTTVQQKKSRGEGQQGQVKMFVPNTGLHLDRSILDMLAILSSFVHKITPLEDLARFGKKSNNRLTSNLYWNLLSALYSTSELGLRNHWASKKAEKLEDEKVKLITSWDAALVEVEKLWAENMKLVKRVESLTKVAGQPGQSEQRNRVVQRDPQPARGDPRQSGRYCGVGPSWSDGGVNEELGVY